VSFDFTLQRLLCSLAAAAALPAVPHTEPASRALPHQHHLLPLAVGRELQGASRAPTAFLRAQSCARALALCRDDRVGAPPC